LYKEHLNSILLSFSTSTDIELLEAIRENSREAFAELFRRHWKKVHAMVWVRIHQEDAAQEIVQELFISLWEKRATLSIGHLPSYLSSAVKNRVLNYIDSQTVRTRHWEKYTRFTAEQDNVTQKDVELAELIEAIESGIEHLPEKSKRVYLLQQEGRSIKEISNLLHLSEKAIEYHITQSIKKLRFHLKDYFVG
jgi:RNA polymerase sigma-70 factor (family 1)